MPAASTRKPAMMKRAAAKIPPTPRAAFIGGRQDSPTPRAAHRRVGCAGSCGCDPCQDNRRASKQVFPHLLVVDVFLLGGVGCMRVALLLPP
eukprot:9401837-Heterocapsa_arctica.AAC.2